MFTGRHVNIFDKSKIELRYNIDTVNLQDPDSNFKEISNNVMGFLKKSTENLNELSSSMKELTNKLKDLQNLLELKTKE